MDVYFYRLGIFFQSIFDVNSQVTWNTKLVTYIDFYRAARRLASRLTQSFECQVTLVCVLVTTSPCSID